MSRFINATLDRGERPVRLDEFTVRLGGRVFWAKNYPYAFGKVGLLMPDRATVFRLADSVAQTDWQAETPNVRGKAQTRQRLSP